MLNLSVTYRMTQLLFKEGWAEGPQQYFGYSFMLAKFTKTANSRLIMIISQAEFIFWAIGTVVDLIVSIYKKFWIEI